ncbi:hypothetical protein A242_28738, partial [Pseudomonas syringae pv. actinidiae ICMP 19095]
TTKPKEITLESLRDDMRKSFMKAMGVENFCIRATNPT